MNFNSKLLLYVVSFASIAWTTIGWSSDNVVIVLDDSGSMNERMTGGVKRIDAAKKAIASVLKQFPPDTKLGLMLLNGERSKQHWAIPLDHLSVLQATRRVEAVSADGGTPLGDRMRDGAEALLRLREKQIYGNYRLLIVTDGEASDANLLALYLPDVLSRGLLVDAIGVDMKQDHSLATRVHTYRRADDGEALSKAVQEVFAEKIDANKTNSDDDFALLQALDDVTAKEALIALSKPNNTPVLGIVPTANMSETIGNSWPANGAPRGQINYSGASLLGTFIITVVSCMLPLVVIVIVLAVFLSKSGGGPKHNRPRR